jgi:hypothetical protein
LLKLAVSDYIDRMADGRSLRQRVITQPRPKAVIGSRQMRWSIFGFLFYRLNSLANLADRLAVAIIARPAREKRLLDDAPLPT